MQKHEGLSKKEVDERILLGQVNKTKKGSTKRISQIIFTNVFTFFNMISFGIIIWLISINEWKNALGAFILIANSLIGIIQEIKAKKAIDKLSIITEEKVEVIREGKIEYILPSFIVLDDLIVLGKDKQIPIDGYIYDGTFEVNESLLTGESNVVIKNKGDKVYAGSYIVSGKAFIKTTLVGNDTYIEKLTNEARIYKKPESDIFKNLQLIMRYVGSIIIPVGVIMFFLSINSHNDYERTVKTVAGAMLGMIPSGLFLLTSTALAVSVVKLSRNKTLVQELYCIEMLARVDTLCLDKTGTITDGTMSVIKTVTIKKLDKYNHNELISDFLYHQTEPNETSKAMINYFGVNESTKIHMTNVRQFSSERKYSTVTYSDLGKIYLGAPEFILQKDYYKISENVMIHAKKGYRVILFAKEEKNTIVPLELIVIKDNIRKDALETIKYFKDNDVSIKIISGDNPVTISSIAKMVGMSHPDNYCDLSNMNEKEIREASIKYDIFGRTTPEGKKIIINELKKNGHKVAMTGDGVNDILALRESDASIAMASGSDAARNVSHMVLMDSNFSSMPKVVEEGRKVINNIEKVAALFLTKTMFSLLVAILSLFFQGSYPLIPIQLTLISFFTIGFPSFFLAFEQNKERVKGKFSYNVLIKAVPGAVTVFITAFIVYLSRTFITNFEFKILSSLVFYSTLFTAYLVFFKTCIPFTKFRLFLISFTAGGIFIAIAIFPHFFELTKITEFTDYQKVILLVNLLLIYPSFKLIAWLLNKVLSKKK